MEQARRELGPEAVLITNRAAAPEARHLGEYEAVFASELPPDDGIDRTAGEEPPPPSHATNLIADRSGTNSKSVLAEIRDLRQQFQAWRQFRMRSADQPRWVAGDPQLTEAFAVLVQAEMERDLALELISGAQNRVRQENSGVEPGAGLRHTRLALARRDGPLPASALWSALAAEIKDALYVDGSLGTEAHEPRVTALVGPPGAGKTATIAKLAVLYGLPARRPAMILSIDNLRVGASEQLRWYASILGIGSRRWRRGALSRNDRRTSRQEPDSDRHARADIQRTRRRFGRSRDAGPPRRYSEATRIAGIDALRGPGTLCRRIRYLPSDAPCFDSC